MPNSFYFHNCLLIQLFQLYFNLCTGIHLIDARTGQYWSEMGIYGNCEEMQKCTLFQEPRNFFLHRCNISLVLIAILWPYSKILDISLSFHMYNYFLTHPQVSAVFYIFHDFPLISMEKNWGMYHFAKHREELFCLKIQSRCILFLLHNILAKFFGYYFRLALPHLISPGILYQGAGPIGNNVKK